MFETLDIQVYIKDDVRPMIGFRMHKTMAKDAIVLPNSKIEETSPQFDIERSQYSASNNHSAIWEYRRISDSASTTLAIDLNLTDTEIVVADASKLPEPSIDLARPGVVFIHGEKITYYTRDVNTNTLGQIRRGVWGTAAATVHKAGLRVVDASLEQKLPETTPADSNLWFNIDPVTKNPTQTGAYNSTTPQALFISASPAVSI